MRLDLLMPLGLACLVLAVPFLLPIPASPILLLGFLGMVLGVALWMRSWVITLLPITAALGPHLLYFQVAGITVFGFLLLVMMLAPFATPLTNRGQWWFNPVARRAVIFVVLWMAWAIFSLLWTNDVGSGLKDIINIVFCLGIMAVLLSNHAHSPERTDKLRLGWVLALATTAVAGLLEVARGYGLPSDLVEGSVAAPTILLEPAGLDPAVRSTLGFSSDFGGFLLLTVPFVLWSIERSSGMLKLLYLLMLLAVAALILYSASRISLIGFGLQIAFYYGLVLRRSWYMPFVVLVSALAVLLVFNTVVMESNLRITEKLDTLGEGDRSTHHRTALTVNGLWMAFKTAGRGIGAGAFEKEIAEDVPVKLPIRRLREWYPHNHWAEVMSEYGLPVFAPYLALLAWMWLLAWRAQRRADGGATATMGRAVLVALVGYVFCGVASGTIMTRPTHWMFFASLVIMSAFLHNALRSSTRSASRADGARLMLDAAAR